MNKSPLYLLTFVLMTLVACTSKYTIKGTTKLHQLSGKTIYLKYLDENSNIVTLDSAQIIHGEFLLVGNTKSAPEMVTLFMDDLAITPLMLESGTTNVFFSPNELMIQGTPLNNSLYSFYQKNQVLDHSFWSQNKENIDELKTMREQVIRDFIENNDNSSLESAIYSIYSDTYPDLFSSEMEYPNENVDLVLPTNHASGTTNSYNKNQGGYFLW